MNSINPRRRNTRSRRQNRPNRNRNSRGEGSKLRRGMMIERTRLSSPNVPVHRYSRTTAQILDMRPATGFNGVAFDCELSFSLNSLFVYLGGTLNATTANPGASDFTALYDSYRLASVEISFMYSGNSAPLAPAASPQLPILNIIFDPTDTSVISLSSILQYQDLHIVQLGNLRTSNGYVLKCRPTPLITAGGSATAASNFNPWLNIDTPTVPYFGIKMFYDSSGSSVSTITGYLNLYVKYNWEFRLSH
jgi:hypothetical protein